MAWVYFGDRFVDEREALVPITTHALHYGTAVFEGIRSYGDGTDASIFRPLDHYERLLRNAAWLDMKTPWNAEMLTALTVEVLQRNGYVDDRYIRPLIYKTSTAIGAGLPAGDALAIVAVSMPRGDVVRPAATAGFSRWRRFPAAACPAGAKITGLYVNSSLAKADAAARGFAQAITLNTREDVAEGYGANLFIVRGGTVFTPPSDADILPGITRHTLLSYLGAQTDLDVREAPLSREAVAAADELFLCGTGMEIQPISHLEGAAIGDGTGEGPVVRRLAAWYRDAVTGRVDVPDNWLVGVRL
ncbi:MAG: aminotransferase class IV [Acidobacteria bacterium]|nr:aminotransferase class IV [Acidobacteriota bacterium]